MRKTTRPCSFIIGALTGVVVAVIASEVPDSESSRREERKLGSQVETFRRLFRQKRVEHLDAVRQLMAMDEEKQKKLVETIIEQAALVMAKSRSRLEASGFAWGTGTADGGEASLLPQDDHDKNAFSLVLENTCFISDVLLRFPDLSHRLLSSNKEWNLVYRWGLSVLAESGLTDESTDKLIDLAAQEIGAKERSPDFVNPYRVIKPKQKRFEDPPPEKKKERKKLRRGPRLSRSEEL